MVHLVSQDLSLAKTGRSGLAGERSGLFMEQIRIVKEMRENDRRNGRADDDIRPRYMVWENVPGALSSNNGEDFRTVLEETARIVEETAVIPEPPRGGWHTSGCIMGNGWSIAWRVHNAEFWGVPQRRRRICLIVDFRGESAPEILFEQKGVFGDSEESRESRESAAGRTDGCTIKAIPVENSPSDSRIKVSENGVVQTLKGRMGTGEGNTPLIMIEMTSTKNTVVTDGISPTLTQRMGTGGNQVNAVLQQIS